MFGRFERMVAGRYLRARRGERFVSIIAIFSLIGIALGVATLIIVMAVMNGFKADLMSRVLGLNGDLNIFSAGHSITSYQDDVVAIHQVPGVVRVTPMAEGTVLIDAGSYSSGGMVRGITQNDLRDLHALSDNIIEGKIDNFQGDDAIAIGSTLAARAGLTIGSKITLLSPNGQATPFGTMPRIRAYRVTAIFDAGVNDYDTSVVLMPLASAQRFLMMPNAVSLIQVATADSLQVRGVTHAIAERLDDPRLRVMDWTQSNNAFLGALAVQQNVMFLILTLIILVAAFNVISSMIMMVKDKTRDIAVLRTLGASRSAIMRIFLMCGASVGVSGTLIGFVLGVVFCLNIEHIQHGVEHLTHTNLFNPEFYYLEHLPAKLIWSEVIEVMVMALMLSFLATLYPSWRAARTDPVEALRHE
ncbi:lipoprotein-releasing ABC transporter permease subunit [Kozakia baliensis]|uniref:Multidrug ABC transporter substrate-binding protein n=1 Tax=Kozakia baliensis TaxID=153496 RepID=A0A1D8UUA8_9PROT|nr:lipoprotein-releasing ABC transporter permease subunit [Kozakia baliensis]AOX17077.1 multidrug ABC transporter substrate-binding protein [Kozakia baliensis]GBR24956.1 lipoprotein releasing system transmembrane protein LolC/E [Kozakia baliensis NRIC 0488]GEL63858.1 LolC/E family lipoprotein releasing system, protein [Kozakia baliensis]